jgi:hypothetical protein
LKRGFITIAQNSNDTDYVRQAYALALSIKNTQSIVNQFAVCVEPGQEIPEKYLRVFDYVIEIPGTDDAKSSDWKIENKWKYYEMSPFDETVILDADMIFTTDISNWWTNMSNYDLCYSSKPVTFRNHEITDNFYRKTFVDNNLPNVYTAFFYFKKTPEVEQYFNTVRDIYRNWKLYFYELIQLSRPKHVSGDVVFALAAHILGYDNSNTYNLLQFVHMKSGVQNIPLNYIAENWTETIPSNFTKSGELTIGNYRQSLPFHYHIKEWLTNDIIEKLEGLYNEQQ